jgi:anti-sigma regulatory factor (Ser/Thr protein kinase)
MESLDAVLAHIENAGSNLDRNTVLRAQTAVEELFANSVLYGNHDNDPQASVWLEVAEVRGELRLRYEDAFAAFDPFENVDTTSKLGGLEIEDRSVGGLGRLLVLQLADDADYAYENGRNCIRLRFASR